MSNKTANGICQFTNSNLLYVGVIFRNLSWILLEKTIQQLKTHYALSCHKHDICILFKSEISQERSIIMNFDKTSYTPVLCYFYTETMKRWSKI